MEKNNIQTKIYDEWMWQKFMFWIYYVFGCAFDQRRSKKKNEINWQDISAHKMPWISRSIVTMCFFSRKRFSNVINSSVIRIGCITKYSTGRRNEGISRNDTFLWYHKLTKQTFPIFNRCNTHSQKRTLNRIAIYRTCFFSIFRSILHLQRSFACFVGRYIAKSIWNSWNWSAVTRVNAHESSSNQLDTFMRFIILCAHFIWCQTKDSDLTKKK